MSTTNKNKRVTRAEVAARSSRRENAAPQLSPAAFMVLDGVVASPLQQLDEPQQPDGAAAVLAAAQADGDLAADGKRMEPKEHWLVVGTLNVHGWN